MNVVDPPTSSSYWVVPGRLLAGAYPGAPDASEHWKKVGALLEAGARAFVNLMEENETNHDGEAFRPYEELVRSMESDSECGRRSIPDLDVPTIDEMTEILDVIDRHLSAGRVVYVHCRGGVGRTGTVIACWLLRHGHASRDDVLETLGALREADRERGHRDSPESRVQREFVASWTTQSGESSPTPNDAVSGEPRYWADDPYWTEALDKLESVRERRRRELVIDLADLDELVRGEQGPAHRLMDALCSVREREGSDGFRGAPQVLTALLIRLAERSRRLSATEGESGPATQRRLGESEFFDLLVSEVDRRIARQIVSGARSVGAVVEPKTASLSIRLDDPAGSRQRLTLFVLDRQRQSDRGRTVRLAPRPVHPTAAARRRPTGDLTRGPRAVGQLSRRRDCLPAVRLSSGTVERPSRARDLATPRGVATAAL